jgi:hypothetical protein
MILLLSSLLIKYHIRTIKNLIYIAKKKNVMVNENSKGQKTVSLVDTIVGEDDAAADCGGGTGTPVRTGDIFILLGFLIGEFGDF